MGRGGSTCREIGDRMMDLIDVPGPSCRGHLAGRFRLSSRMDKQGTPDSGATRFDSVSTSDMPTSPSISRECGESEADVGCLGVSREAEKSPRGTTKHRFEEEPNSDNSVITEETSLDMKTPNGFT